MPSHRVITADLAVVIKICGQEAPFRPSSASI
jgi:hypothetical protein